MTSLPLLRRRTDEKKRRPLTVLFCFIIGARNWGLAALLEIENNTNLCKHSRTPAMVYSERQERREKEGMRVKARRGEDCFETGERSFFVQLTALCITVTAADQLLSLSLYCQTDNSLQSTTLLAFAPTTIRVQSGPEKGGHHRVFVLSSVLFSSDEYFFRFQPGLPLTYCSTEQRCSELFLTSVNSSVNDSDRPIYIYIQLLFTK